MSSAINAMLGESFQPPVTAYSAHDRGDELLRTRTQELLGPDPGAPRNPDHGHALAKTGNPSRAAVSDAAMSERAECVMLNKGPHIDEAVVVLDSILRRMADHHYKKIALMPSLHPWHPDSVSGGINRPKRSD